jgi:glycosyltransferase involved in cell wall biosynthesis
MGRLDVVKGVLVLLKAWEILEKECGGKAPILVIAGNGPLRSLVEERVAKLNSVQFVGVLTGDAKKRALKECKAVIVPSIWWEPLGLIVYEAYDYGRPVLASRSGGLPEIVLNGKTGLLHEPGNAEQLSQHVLEIERHPELILKMGSQGRVWLEQNTNEKDWQNAFSNVLNHALQR